MINGTFCHERGCPNRNSKFIEGEWIKYRKCFECGCEVPEDEDCCTDYEGDPDSEDMYLER